MPDISPFFGEVYAFGQVYAFKGYITALGMWDTNPVVCITSFRSILVYIGELTVFLPKDVETVVKETIH